MHRFPSLRVVLTFAILIATLAVIYRLHGQQHDGPPIASSPSQLLSTVPVSMASPGRQSSTVIVVGSGLAGLTAAFAALHANAPAVLLLERAAKPGGNSIKASSGINGAPTRFQKLPLPDTSFFHDSVKSAGKRLTLFPAEQARRESLIRLLTDSSASAVNLLADEVGVDLSVVTQLGGHSCARTHRGAGTTPPGADIVTKLLAKLRADKRFELRTGCEVTKLLSVPPQNTPGRVLNVVGVEFRSGTQLTSATGPVVFATGGFAGDATGLLAAYRPDLEGLPSTNEPRSGMHRLLTDVGAQLVDMDSVQIHPTGFVDPANPQLPLKFLAAEMLRGEGAILLHKGRRFVNELATREHVSRVIMDLDPTTEAVKQWDIQLLLDPGACKAAAAHVGFYTWKGLLSKKRVSELDDATRATIREYSSIVAGQSRDALGRDAFGHWELDGSLDDDAKEVCLGRVTPVTHFTMGGVVINANSQVVSSDLGSQDQLPVPGLWAAGEITGGIHGDNRLGGSSLLECVVFGGIAGKQAAELARSEV